MKTLALLLTLVTASALAAGDIYTFDFEEIADDVWVGVRPDAPRFPVMGSTTFVVSDEGVVVFDGGGAPMMAEQIIEKIRSLTDKPVTHVVISHWHGDHSFGAYRFAEEFPGVKFIAHRFTVKVIDSPRIHYIDRGATYIERNREEMQLIVDTGATSEGEQVSQVDRHEYARILEDANLIDREAKRSRVIRPDVIMDDTYTIDSGERRIELLHLGHANTAGDIVMWLPKERIVATGDIVVLPSPYAFNVPPRSWAETLRNINALEYDILVPGHGELQRNTDYVDLIIEAADSIADQRDAMLADGLSIEGVEAALDFSAFEERFTGGDEYVANYYTAYFEAPFRKAAMKALTGEPMVAIDTAEVVPFSEEKWDIEAASAEQLEYLGQEAIKLQGGTAFLKDVDLKNAIVEFDIAATAERGFGGLMFRAEDNRNYEHFYIRPHQSGQPDANQYTPVTHGVSAWQLYHGPEYATPIEYKTDQWMHVKIVYAGTRADIYIDSDEPVLRVQNLRRGEESGLVGINTAQFAPAYFANVKVSPLANAFVLPTLPAVQSQANPDLVTSWQVSEPFSHEDLAGMTTLPGQHSDELQWHEAEAEHTGLVNLASVPIQGELQNTRFARLTIDANLGDEKTLKFGYSDSAKVFLNGVLLYSGDNTYRSRDYRYLGTIGLFDSVPLILKDGENEVLIAVTEAFGGWGVMAELSD